MKKTIFGCLSAAAVALSLQFTSVTAQAGLFSDCTPCDAIGDCDVSADCDTNGNCDVSADFDSCDPCDSTCGPQAGKWFVNGFVEAGFWANQYGKTNVYPSDDSSRHNLKLSPGNMGALQNVQHTGFQVNQTYVSVGRSVNGKHGWDFGGQADFVFGTDAWMVQSVGLENSNGHDVEGWGTGDYYSAFAQAYFQAAYKDLNIYAGKFNSPFGGQGFRGDNNFFYSFSPTWNFTPATASGVYGTYKLADRLTLLGGWIVPDMCGETSHNNAFLAGAKFRATNRLNLDYTFAFGQISGKYSANPFVTNVDYFVNTLKATYNIGKKWKTVVDWTLVDMQNDPSNNHTSWGANAALYYQYRKNLAFGLRYSYVTGSSNQYGIGGLYGYPDTNLTSVVEDWSALSFGANWTPTKWLIVKPEIRWDFVDRSTGQYFSHKGTGGGENQQFSGGLSTVVKF